MYLEDLEAIFYTEDVFPNEQSDEIENGPESYMEKQTTKKFFICDMCKKEFMQKNRLAKHLQRHVMENAESEHQYKRFMLENFDMTCDLCSTTSVSVSHARRHYKDIHQMDNGFIKCCDLKFYSNPTIMQHIGAHLNPDKFK